jgi:outer membrane autotransporter protein
MGIIAQSIGGGGGIASDAFNVSDVAIMIGGQTGASGNGDAVHVVNSGAMGLTGDNSVGVFAQSVGGGGGMVRPGGGVTNVVTMDGGTGNGGAVTVDNTASQLVLNGQNSIGVYAQSVGGGGGAVGLNVDPPGQVGAFLFSGTAGGSGTAAAVTLNQTGNVLATGLNSMALVAQSSAADGQGAITVDITNPSSDRSLVLGGLGSGAGVEILDGAANTLNNAGVIAAVPLITGSITGVSDNDGTFTVAGPVPGVVDGTQGFAVIASGGLGTTVNNSGLMMGSVDLGLTGANALNNLQGGMFDTGAAVVLGAGNTLTNAGVLAPGGYYHLAATAITGNLVQTATGTTGVDLDIRSVATDRITVSGTASLSGRVLANLTDPLTAPGYALPGTHAKTILTASGGVDHTGLTLAAFNTAVATYALIYPDAQSVDLQYVVDYSPAGLTGNQHAMGDAVNLIQTAQNAPAFRPIATNLFYLPDVATLGGAYDLLSGEGIAALEQASFDSSERFLAAAGAQLADWRSMPRTAEHAWHLWMMPYGYSALYGGDKTMGSAKVKDQAYGIAGGVDYQISANALIGVAVGGGTTWINIPDRRTKASTDAVHFQLYGGWSDEAYYADGAFSYGLFKNVESRVAVIPGVILPRSLFVDGPYIVPGFSETPGARFNSSSYSGHLEAGYHVDLGIVRATPFIGLDFGSLTTDGFTETNADKVSVIGLIADRHVVDSLPGRLGVTFDGTFDLGGDLTLAGWLKGTWKHEFDISRTTRTRFISAPEQVFQVHGAQPARETGVVDTGLRLTIDGHLSVYANYSGAFGGPNSSHTGTAGVSITW